MDVIRVHDRDRIAAFLRKETPTHIYALGDLDETYWPHTTWYAAEVGNEIQAICLLFSQFQPPVLLAICERGNTAMRPLLREICPELPHRLYAHLSPGLGDIVSEHYDIESHGEHLKMYLAEQSKLEGIDVSRAVRLGVDAADALGEFYRDTSPNAIEGGQVFDRSMLATGQYFGIWEDKRLISAAGVHVFSPRYGVAALANIATLPGFRGRGLATITAARLCNSLLEHVEHLGLNVRTDNAAAIRCYHKLGFQTVARYFECSLKRRSE